MRHLIEYMHVTALAALFLAFSGCESPSIVTPEKIAFLDHQQRPLSLSRVIERLGPTPPGREPFFGYTLAGGNVSIEFWICEASKGAVPDEILMVVERSSKGARIIWPNDLKGTNIDSILRKTWPKMYQ